MYTKVYASDAWSLIKAAIRQQAAHPNRANAMAFADQAEEFYRASSSAQTPHGRPLLLYYAFMNLVKAFCLHRGNAAVLGKAKHGLQETSNHSVALDQGAVLAEPTAAPSPTNATPRAQVFHEFLTSALGTGLPTPYTYQVRDVLSCSLVGHRLWTEAADSNDHFLKLTNIEFMHDDTARTLWLRAHIADSSLTRHGFTQTEVTNGGFGAGWQAVTLGVAHPIGVTVWEQIPTVTYTHRPSDQLEALAATARQVFYRSLTTSEPYRNYYVFVPPTGHTKHHQLASRYILLFFLGSVTRYHPADFETYLDGKYGPFLAEFLASEPSQMLFEMACLFLQREVVTVGLS
jgi:hypothetical protein